MRHTIFAAEIGYSYILQWDLPEKGGALTARVPRHDSSASKPRPKPRQVAVAVKGIGQEVSDGRQRETRKSKKRMNDNKKRLLRAVNVCVAGADSVDRLGSVSKAPGRMVLSWLS